MEKSHFGVFVGDPRKRSGHARRSRDGNSGRIGSGKKFIPDAVPVVLHDEGAPTGYVVEKTLIGAREFGAKFVSTDADNDGVVMRERAELQGVSVQHFDVNSEAAQGIGDWFSFGRDVADVKIRRYVDVERMDDRLCRLAPENGRHGGERLKRSGEFLAGAHGVGGNGDIAGGEFCGGSHGEFCVLIARAGEVEINRRAGDEAVGDVQPS